MFKFKSNYLLAASLLFVTEVLIAVYLHDRFVRPYVGDYLVVILMYCFIKSFFDLPVRSTAIAVLVFSYVIELMQYFNIVGLTGLQDSKLASTVIGTSFEWIDLLAYTLGVMTILWFEDNKFYRVSRVLN